MRRHELDDMLGTEDNDLREVTSSSSCAIPRLDRRTGRSGRHRPTCSRRPCRITWCGTDGQKTDGRFRRCCWGPGAAQHREPAQPETRRGLPDHRSREQRQPPWGIIYAFCKCNSGSLRVSRANPTRWSGHLWKSQVVLELGLLPYIPSLAHGSRFWQFGTSHVDPHAIQSDPAGLCNSKK